MLASSGKLMRLQSKIFQNQKLFKKDYKSYVNKNENEMDTLKKIFLLI